MEFQVEAEVAYTRMISVSVDPPDVNAALRAGLDARWTFLCDPERRYQQELELRESTDPLHDPYTPVVFTLYPDLAVHRAYHGYWFWGRPSNIELRADFRTITREIRDTWEGSGP